MTAQTVHSLWRTFSTSQRATVSRYLSGSGAARARRLAALLADPAPVPLADGVAPSSRAEPAGAKQPGAVMRNRMREAAAALGAGVLTLILVGGMAGFLAGLAVAFGIWRWLRKQSDPVTRRRLREQEQAVAQLPLVTALLTACLAAGSGPREAALSVGNSVGGPLGTRLVLVADELRLGAEPSAAWARVAELPSAVGLARCLERAHRSGAPAVESMSRLAAECRAARARTAAARARRAGVLVTAPLGLCFLPAFLLAGVVPVIIGLAHSLL